MSGFNALRQVHAGMKQGGRMKLDADGDTYLYNSADDTVDLYINGAKDFTFTANTLTAQSGSSIATNTIAETTSATGVTIDGLTLKDLTILDGASGNVIDLSNSSDITLGNSSTVWVTATSSELALAAGHTLTLSGGTSGTVTIQTASAAGTWTMTLPADDGDAGEQLQTNGSGVTTWEAAGSLREVKEIISDLSDKAGDALNRMLDASVYAFRYQVGARPTTGDFETVYHGIVGDEYPEVLHHKGRIFSPVSAFGETCLAIKALAQRVAALEASHA